MSRPPVLLGRVALVTGASRGLGRAIALHLAAQGADVGVNYVESDTAAQAVVAEVGALGRRAIALRADVADADAVRVMVARLRDALGPCSVLVANAGLIERATILDLAPERWQRMLDVTLKGPFLCAREVAPAMIAAGWGRIVTISSDAGKRGGQSTGPHYSAAKAGVLGLMRGMALQLAPHGVTVNDVCPVDIPVERWQGRSAEQLAATLAGVPTGRFGTPSDVAAAVAFLASDDSRHITGVSLDVSGGAILT